MGTKIQTKKLFDKFLRNFTQSSKQNYLQFEDSKTNIYKAL